MLLFDSCGMSAELIGGTFKLSELDGKIKNNNKGKNKLIALKFTIISFIGVLNNGCHFFSGFI
jgi:hypothetical protein